MAARKVSRRVTIEELKEKAAKVSENRLAMAKPFVLKTLGVEVLVAPPAGDDFYKKAVAIGFGGGGVSDIDDSFIRTLVKASVVEPELDEEAIDAIIANSYADFNNLALECFSMAQDLGQEDTGKAEAFLPEVGGSTST